jgi:RING finger protein 26
VRDVFPFDPGFESDTDVDDGGEEDESGEDEDDMDGNGVGDDDGSETQTELTISDNDDDSESDSNTAGSDSTVSLNSQTFSSDESENEIDIQLPINEGGYSLRSRSSTPSRVVKGMNPEDFEREIERERDKRKCVVCQDLNKSVLILPCRHMCLCVGCANHIVRSRFIERRICPLCRTRIERVMDVYV